MSGCDRPDPSPAACPATAPDRGAAVSREWKPGDVATFDWKNMPIETGVRVSANLCRDHDDLTVDHWHLSGGGFTQYDDYARPLVVIDPEDREQAERLLRAWYMVADADDVSMTFDRMQDALRSLLTPPKPEEPTGLGAVVEDADGKRYIRTCQGTLNAWREERTGLSRGWGRFAAVKVLSEGVTP